MELPGSLVEIIGARLISEQALDIPHSGNCPRIQATHETRKGPAVYADLIPFNQLLSLALGNDRSRSFAFTNIRGLAFADASREAEGEEHRAEDY